MRILTVADHLGTRGGLEMNQLTTCRALADRGHRIDLAYVSPGDLLDGWAEVADSRTLVTGLPDTGRDPFTTSYRLLEAAHGFRYLQPDVIYAFRYLDLPLAAAVSRLTRAPVVFHLSQPRPQRIPFIIKRSFSNVAMTLAASYDTASRWRGSGLSAESVVVVHTGIDASVYLAVPDRARQATRADLGIEPEAFVALYSGRIMKEKGLEMLMEAARLLTSDLPDLRLVVAGGPPVESDAREADRYRSELQARAGPADIRWLGFRRDMVPIIGAADVAVAPSVRAEPFSRSVMESLACGVPTVATDVGGTPEILVGDLQRLLIPAGDPVALAEAIGALRGWRRTDPGLGDRCREGVVHRLALSRMVDTVEAALASVARFRSDDPLEAYS